MAQNTQEILNRTGIIEAVTDPLIQIEGKVQLLPLHDFSVFDLFCPALPAKCTENRHRTKIIQMVEHRFDSQ